MGFDDGRIVFDSENGAYYAGQTVHGKLIFEQEKLKTFRGIYVKMKGYCKVHWTTSHTRRVNDRTETYTVSHNSYENYYDRKQYLVGKDSGDYHLKPGKYEFLFECPIPANCPSSFEGSHGHIRYEFKAVVDRAFKFDQEKLAVVKVFTPLDLNVNPYCREPMTFEFQETFCCWCVSSGTCETLIKLPVSGYCPGQVIPIEINCTNNSNVEIDKIKFAIKKEIIFHATNQPGTKYDHDTVAEIKKGPIPGNTTRSWTLEMEVPVMDIYNVDPCRYIDIDYQFKVTVEAEGCHSDNDESQRIVFGTIPLIGFQDNVQNPLQDQLPLQPLPPINTYPSPPVINQPLPSGPVQVTPSQTYLGGSPYPANSSYPSAPYPAGAPYPGGNQPYPSGRTSPFPGGSPYPTNSPYPASQPNNSPYPTPNPVHQTFANSPNPGTPNQQAPYPAGTSPYPTPVVSPYPPNNTPYSASAPNEPSPPYPGSGPNVAPPPYPNSGLHAASPPYPTTGPNPSPYSTGVSPYPGHAVSASKEEKGDVTIPLLPMGAAIPYPTSPSTPANPYATASAPVPATPDTEEKPMLPSDTTNTSSYNPDIVKDEKK